MISNHCYKRDRSLEWSKCFEVGCFFPSLSFFLWREKNGRRTKQQCCAALKWFSSSFKQPVYCCCGCVRFLDDYVLAANVNKRTAPAAQLGHAVNVVRSENVRKEFLVLDFFLGFAAVFYLFKTV